MTLNSKDYARIVVNSATDPGVLFNIGNVPVSLQYSWEATAVNVGVATLSGATRAVSELKHSGVEFNPQSFLTQKFDQFTENKGAGLVTSGALTLGAAGITLAEVSPDPLGDQHDPDQDQERQSQHFQRGISLDELADRFGEHQHHTQKNPVIIHYCSFIAIYAVFCK